MCTGGNGRTVSTVLREKQRANALIETPVIACAGITPNRFESFTLYELHILANSLASYAFDTSDGRTVLARSKAKVLLRELSNIQTARSEYPKCCGLSMPRISTPV